MRALKIVGAACLLAAFTFTAQDAKAVDCPLGFINNETVDEIIIDGGSCLISDVQVLGNVRIRNGVEVVIRQSKVFGRIRIVDTMAIGVFSNEVINEDIRIIRPSEAFIADNVITSTGEKYMLLVRDVATEAFLLNNRVEQGEINCRPRENPNAIARGNIALEVNCPGQLRE